MKRVKLLLLLFVFILGCTKDYDEIPAETDQAVLKAAREGETMRPLKFIKSSGPLEIIPGGGECNYPPDVFVYISGRGNATHLGNFTVTNEYCAANGIPVSSIEGKLTAANGDEIHTMIPEPWNPNYVYPGDDGNMYYVYTILGGTGRFEDASGSILMWGTVTFTGPLSGTWEMKGEGEISY